MSTIEKEKYEKLAYYTLSLQDEQFIHQHVVDAFTAQNADKNTKPISLTFALVGLYLYIFKNFNGRQVQNFHILMSNHKKVWPSIVLPIKTAPINIDQILNTKPGIERNILIKTWCTLVWETYLPNYETIIKLVEHYSHFSKLNNE